METSRNVGPCKYALAFSLAPILIQKVLCRTEHQSTFLRGHCKFEVTFLSLPSLYSILLSVRRPDYKKYQHYIDVQGEVIQTHAAQRQLFRLLNDLRKKGFFKSHKS